MSIPVRLLSSSRDHDIPRLLRDTIAISVLIPPQERLEHGLCVDRAHSLAQVVMLCRKLPLSLQVLEYLDACPLAHLEHWFLGTIECECSPCLQLLDLLLGSLVG